MEDFTCPHCKKNIDKSIIARYFAMLGGKKSRRKLSSEDAKKMAEKRWKKGGKQ
jgi:hypothetical protein